MHLPMICCSHAQDRWVQLGGEETGEVRIRMSVVPGAPESPAVQQMVALFSSDFNRASVATLQVGALGGSQPIDDVLMRRALLGATRSSSMLCHAVV
jgi:hypothetical protein